MNDTITGKYRYAMSRSLKKNIREVALTKLRIKIDDNIPWNTSCASLSKDDCPFYCFTLRNKKEVLDENTQYMSNHLCLAPENNWRVGCYIQIYNQRGSKNFKVLQRWKRRALRCRS